MYKQVIVVNKELNMSAGKMAAMVAHGSIAFLTKCIRRCEKSHDAINNELHFIGKIDSGIYYEWIAGGFTKVILEVENEAQMKTVIAKAIEHDMHLDYDFFNIVDESTEFEGVPCWAVIAFAPMDADRINQVTGHLNLFGYKNSSIEDSKNKKIVFKNGERITVEEQMEGGES